MALDFPTAPTLNQKFPASPVNGVPTYTWDGEKWTTVGGSIAGVPPGGDPPGTATPLMNITPAVVGTATKYSREDHRHPTDTSKADKTYADSQDALKVSKAGDTMTGDLTLSPVSGSQNLVMNSVAGSAAGAILSTAGIPKWSFARGTDDSFFLYDNALGGYVFIAPSSGTTVDFYKRIAGAATIASAAEYLSNSQPAKLLTPGAAWTAAAPVVAGSSTALTPDFSTALDFSWTYSSASGAVNNGTNLKPGQKGVIYVTAGSPGCAITTWGSQYKFPGGTKPTMSTASGAIDAISYTILSSTQILCSFQGNFA